MYIAMNRFQVVRGHEAEFEQVWADRDTRLQDTLRGAEHEDHTPPCQTTNSSSRLWSLSSTTRR